MSDEQLKFPFKDQEKYGDVRTIAERAGIELRTVDEEDGVPFHCGGRMQVKGGMWGPDYARCNSCGLLMSNAASPHINGGYVLKDEIIEQYGDSLWTTQEGDEAEQENTEAEG